MGDVWSPNDPLVFCVSVPGEARGWFYGVVVPDANVERERWYDSERYIERNREVEIFKIGRNYEEFIERLGGERSENKSKYLPWIEADIAAVGDDVDNNNDLVKYLMMTYYTGGDRTMINHDMLNEFENNDKNSNGIYMYNNKMKYLILNHVYSCKVRLLFDDGG